MADDKNKLSGTESAAVLLLSLGEEHAASILKNMGPREVQKVSAAMSSLSGDAGKQVGAVLNDFVTNASSQSSLGVSLIFSMSRINTAKANPVAYIILKNSERFRT